MADRKDADPIHIALVDDHIATTRGLKLILELDPDLRITLEAKDGNDFLGQLKTTELLPDIVVLDISMPGLDGVATIDHLQQKYPSIKIIIFSLFNKPDTVINVISRGARGFINKSADPVLLREAIHKVHNEGYYISDLVKKELFENRLSPGRKRRGFYGREHLTDLEIAFIRYAASDLTYVEIAEKMNKTRSTLENYRDSLFKKLNVSNRAALIVYAYNNGLIDVFTD